MKVDVDNVIHKISVVLPDGEWRLAETDRVRQTVTINGQDSIGSEEIDAHIALLRKAKKILDEG